MQLLPADHLHLVCQNFLGVPQVAIPPLPCLPSADSPATTRKLVLVWDIDETLVIFNSLLTGSWAMAHGGHGREMLCRLGERWEAGILGLADSRFFYKQVCPQAWWQEMKSNIECNFQVGSAAAMVLFQNMWILVGWERLCRRMGLQNVSVWLS